MIPSDERELHEATDAMRWFITISLTGGNPRYSSLSHRPPWTILDPLQHAHLCMSPFQGGHLDEVADHSRI